MRFSTRPLLWYLSCRSSSSYDDILPRVARSYEAPGVYRSDSREGTGSPSRWTDSCRERRLVVWRGTRSYVHAQKNVWIPRA